MLALRWTGAPPGTRSRRCRCSRLSVRRRSRVSSSGRFSVAKGFYVRGDPERAIAGYSQLYNKPQAAIVYGGPGSGYATVTAVNMVGWSWQVSARAQICVVGRSPRAQLPFCEFHARSNTARRDLTWAEVSLLEALRYFDRAAGYRWRQAVQTSSEGVTAIKLGAGSLIRADELLRVGSAESGVDSRFRELLGDLVAVLPSTIAFDGDLWVPETLPWSLTCRDAGRC